MREEKSWRVVEVDIVWVQSDMSSVVTEEVGRSQNLGLGLVGTGFGM